MQKSSLLLAVTLAFAPLVWANDVTINGTGVSLEANKTPINTPRNADAVASLPKDYHLAVPGKFTVAVAA
jgi:polar amino acid transport system substrate-binding protein